VATGEEIERPAGREVEQVPRDVAVVEVSGLRTDGARRDLDFEGNAAAGRYFKALLREVHVLGVVEDLDLVVLPCVGHGGNLEPAVADEHDSIRFSICPDGAIREGECADAPGAVGFKDAIEVAGDDFGGWAGLGGHRESVQGCHWTLESGEKAGAVATLRGLPLRVLFRAV